MIACTDASDYRGRPVLFLLGVLGVWVAARASFVTWKEDAVAHNAPRAGVAEAVRSSRPFWAYTPVPPELVVMKDDDKEGVIPPVWATPIKRPTILATTAPQHSFRPKKLRMAPKAVPAPMLLKTDALFLAKAAPPSPIFIPSQPYAPVLQSPEPKKHSRWSASAWALWRPGEKVGAGTGATLPLYGGSQAGARMAYRVNRAKALDIYVRASTPLVARTGKEVALGASIQPIKGVNAAIAVEQRIRLDGEGKRTAPAIFAYGGFGPHKVGSFEAEGYAQGGIVGVKERIPFADGAVTVRKTIATLGNSPVHLGGGIWGGAQKGASRLDIGPRVSADIPVSDKRRVRVALDWRQRIGGEANPGSGLALSIGTDF